MCKVVKTQPVQRVSVLPLIHTITWRSLSAYCSDPSWPCWIAAAFSVSSKCLRPLSLSLHSFLSLQCVGMFSHFSLVWLFSTLWIVACQFPLSTRFFRQEYCSELLCPPPGDLPNPGIEPVSHVSCIAGGFFTHWATWKPISLQGVFPIPNQPSLSLCTDENDLIFSSFSLISLQTLLRVNSETCSLQKVISCSLDDKFSHHCLLSLGDLLGIFYICSMAFYA